jgi:hypothetical protein
VSQQIKTVLLSEVKIKDYKVHLRAAELTDHVLTAGGHSGMDVILRKIVYDHPLQGRVVLDDEHARLALAAPVKPQAV